MVENLRIQKQKTLLLQSRADVGGLIIEMSSLLLCKLWLLISLLTTHLSGQSGLLWLWSHLPNQ